MKKMKIVLSLLLISIFPFSFTSGQENKSEKKLKIIVADKSGTKVVIDTIFIWDKAIDSLKIKDGSVVYIGKKRGTGKDVFIITKSGDAETSKDKHYEIIADLEKEGVRSYKHFNYVYVNDDEDTLKEGDDKFDIRIGEFESGDDSDNTKYVIAKNGIVVSIEGDDEARINELIDLIRQKLEIKDMETDKPSIKSTEKKDNKNM